MSTVKKDDMVTLYSTGTSPFIPKGEKIVVHSIAAKTLIERGYAVKEEDIKKTTKEEDIKKKKFD